MMMRAKQQDKLMATLAQKRKIFGLEKKQEPILQMNQSILRIKT